MIIMDYVARFTELAHFAKDYVATDSCHSGVIRNQQNLFSYVRPTAVVKLLQHSGLGSNTGMGFHPRNDLHQCKKVRLFIWIFGLISKTV